MSAHTDNDWSEAALALYGLSKLPKNQRTPDAEGS